ncbi:MAG: hypothetical protein KDA68_21180, partial [Planctomycetaceae bacterium]|nr:hypothetical protein [Planctomycetaceae bacterium]
MRRVPFFSSLFLGFLTFANVLPGQIIRPVPPILPPNPTPVTTFRVKLWNITAQVKDQAAKVQISQV